MDNFNKKKFDLIKISCKNDHFLCKHCSSAPKLQIPETKKFIVQCCQKDNKKTYIDLQNLKENYIVGDQEDTDDILQCQEHYKNFKDYCQICLKNYCENCVKCNHDKVNIDNKNLEEDIKKLENLFSLREGNNELNEQEFQITSITKKNIVNEFQLLQIIVSIIINDYLRAKNYHLCICIQNLCSYYMNHPPDDNSENIVNEFSINSPHELVDSKTLEKIEIYQYCFDLNKLKVSLPNLKILSLKNNNISDVEVLINCDFKNLEQLYLDINKIDDNILNHINGMKFEKLRVLSLKQNYLTDYGIFEKIKIFKNLKAFDISSNRFKNKEFFQNKKIDLNSIEELILSNGVFDSNSIENISALNLENLRKLDLSSNNLSSLNFVRNSNWPKLENLILNENDIFDLKELITKFKDFGQNLMIVIENNLIKDETQINELVGSNEKIKIKYKLISEILLKENNVNEQVTQV